MLPTANAWRPGANQEQERPPRAATSDCHEAWIGSLLVPRASGLGTAGPPSIACPTRARVNGRQWQFWSLTRNMTVSIHLARSHKTRANLFGVESMHGRLEYEPEQIPAGVADAQPEMSFQSMLSRLQQTM
jgi:hypothetical protein